MKKLEHIPLNGELPSPKGVALAILELCRRDDTTTAQVAHIAQTDPALASRLIRQANTVGQGAGRPVASVTDAILRLGMGTVRNLAMGFSLVDQYQNGPCEGFDYQAFWSHSLLMALAAQTFCTMANVGSSEELFACGLLSQVGRLSLATVYPAAYAQLLKNPEPTRSLAALEHEHLQTDHNELTAALLTEWGIPGALVEPIYHHENPESAGFSAGSRPHQLTHLLYLARRVADLGLAAEAEHSGRTAELLLLGSKIGLSAEELGTTIDELVRRWREWGELLRVPASALPSFAQMSTPHALRPEERSSAGALRVLLVDDDPTTRCIMETVLRDALGHSVVCARTGSEALALAVEAQPQIVITDWLMPGLSGLELTRALRATEWGQTIYLIMLTSLDTEEEVSEAFEAGVDDFLAKPVNLRTLRARLRAAWHYVQLLEAWERDRAQLKQFAAELAISNRRLEHAAMTDLLTGLPNRRAGMAALTKAWAASQRFEQPLSVLVLDIDHFKRVNDTHGHAVGDKVLTEVAQEIHRAARKNDSVCRMGGEEFLMICQNTDLKAALFAADRLRRTIEAMTIEAGGVKIRSSVSIGVASREARMADSDAMINAADRALYRAKESGRNRSCIIVQGQLRCMP
ncbi:diguanylate cyclase [Thauera sp.]|jgi:diguanylate cyclase (GGDEF)-like protein|uniref:GGDEF domain-containing response regulator n=1 Tax=Thauera sp. TaxID=1905334 RepID=UPI002A371CCF|nr:diguanylate cyclase [Thauera sp.]MDX9885948.1 diguanylate cyclase [Thauera sp.]